jgi:DNA-binding PadR family transcriptional regulator
MRYSHPAMEGMWWAGRFGHDPGFGHGHGRGRGGKPWWAEAMGEPPPRAERGGVRYLVLEAIKDQPRHGYEIIQHIEQRTDGRYRPSPGVIYPTLQMLEELGHAHVIEQEGRKAYAITDQGKQDLEANQSQVEDFYARFGEDSFEDYAEDFGELMKFFARVMKTVRIGMHRGRMSPGTVRTIRQALEEALKKIEAALHDRGP